MEMSESKVVLSPTAVTNLQAQFEIFEKPENRDELDIHISQAASAGEPLKTAHSAVEELDWLWRSC